MTGLTIITKGSIFHTVQRMLGTSKFLTYSPFRENDIQQDFSAYPISKNPRQKNKAYHTINEDSNPASSQILFDAQTMLQTGDYSEYLLKKVESKVKRKRGPKRPSHNSFSIQPSAPIAPNVHGNGLEVPNSLLQTFYMPSNSQTLDESRYSTGLYHGKPKHHNEDYDGFLNGLSRTLTVDSARSWKDSVEPTGRGKVEQMDKENMHVNVK